MSDKIDVVRSTALRLLFLLALVVVLPFAGSSQSLSAGIPENAVAKRYGGGWECKPGFRKANRSCVTVKVPVNAYATDLSYGSGWECNRGFKKDRRNACTAIKVPKNAYLNASGDGWKCERGYREINEVCDVVKVPQHGFLTDSSYGSGWECSRGYRPIDKRCAAINIPTNGYLNASSSDWKCKRGYRAANDACVVVKVPTNGFFVDISYGTGWRCMRGYQTVGNSCVTVKLPAMAHLDSSGNDWACNKPYRKNEKGCALADGRR